MGCDCCAKLMGIFKRFFICNALLWWSIAICQMVVVVVWFVRFVGMKESLTEYLDETDLNLHNSTLPLSLSLPLLISTLDWTGLDLIPELTLTRALVNTSLSQ